MAGIALRTPWRTPGASAARRRLWVALGTTGWARLLGPRPGLPMPEVVRDNHYVPQALIRRWSTDELHVHAYRLLVSHAAVPLWSLQSIKTVAYARDLYTEVAEGEERDAFEKWIQEEFETPGFEAVDRLVRGLPLSPEDWRALVRLYAAQNVRTPSSYLEFKAWCGTALQPALDATVARAAELLRDARQRPSSTAEARATPPVRAGLRNEFEDLLRVKIDEAPDADGRVAIRAEMTAGRSLWIAQMRHLLKGVAERLSDHRWHIWAPSGEEEWPLTDHPALRINYDGPDKYTVGGGWGFDGSDLMMPLSPRHLLHVRVGHREAPRSVCTVDVTRRVQRLYAETALRWVFCTAPDARVAAVRPRVVDAVRFKDEAEQWRGWHDQQTGADGA